jgi:hypothetical protein
MSDGVRATYLIPGRWHPFVRGHPHTHGRGKHMGLSRQRYKRKALSYLARAAYGYAASGLAQTLSCCCLRQIVTTLHRSQARPTPCHLARTTR